MWRIFLLMWMAGAILVDCGNTFAAAPRESTGAMDRAIAPFVAAHDYPGAPRIALVIGNGEYGNNSHDVVRQNAPRDARVVGKTLRALGYDVTVLSNATPALMQRSIAELRDRLTTGGIGLFYFAGHGMRIGGRRC